ncbi:MAG TPA: M50 family metallopeptidase [Acidimicrobiales bacterium]|nr:M50 family metallopeptidase [Acidimicrobiales bacterium]
MVWGATGFAGVERIDPASWLVLATGVAAALAVVVDGVWRWARGVVTIAHEAGHAVAALLTGRRLTGIRLHSDTSGLTLSTGRPRGPGMIVTAAAGYVSPSLVGLAGVALLALDRVTVMLWASAALLVAMLVMVRNWYGALSLTVTGGVVVGISLYTSAEVQAAFAYAMTWFLLLGAVRPVAELRAQRRYQPGAPTDADILARLTRVPGTVWVVLFGLATVAALGAGGWLLLT